MYLGFIVNSVAMKLYLPEKKVADIHQQCLDLLRTGKTSVRPIAKVIGKLTATIKAILPAPLQYRHLQHLKSQALHQNNQSYEIVVDLSVECKQELSWWAESITVWKGRSVLKLRPDLAINTTTDASHMDWGAHCNSVKTQGLWTDEKKKLHINALEIEAVMFAVQSFVKDQQKIHVHLKMDNTTTVAYVNKMGGTKSLAMSNISKQLWDFCLQKEITIDQSHICGRR